MNKIFFSERKVIKNQKNTFEGWYFRHDGAYKFSVIVGFTNNEFNPHSFIQYIDEKTSHYFRFQTDELKFCNDGMTIKIRENVLSLSGIDLRLSDESIFLEIKVGYLSHNLYKKSLYSPSVMGPFSYLSLPCNHALISLKHTVSGTIQINNQRFYADGYGYIEKDFGKAFPKNYVWVHAVGRNASIMLAVAYPLIFNMKGFLCVVQNDNKQYNFSKYTRAKLKDFSLTSTTASATLKTRKSHLAFSASMGEKAQELIAPSKASKMDTFIQETIAAPFSARLVLNGKPIDLSDIKTCALEINLKD